MNTHSMSIYVPSTVDMKTPIAGSLMHAAIKKEVKRHMVNLFGGSTSHEAHGSWEGPDGNLVEEPIYVVTATMPKEQYEAKKEQVFGLARLLARKMGQHSVTVVDNGVMHFVEPREGK